MSAELSTRKNDAAGCSIYSHSKKILIAQLHSHRVVSPTPILPTLQSSLPTKSKLWVKLAADDTVQWVQALVQSCIDAQAYEVARPVQDWQWTNMCKNLRHKSWV